MKTIVIVGSGLAGYTLAKEIRKQDASAVITLITQDTGEQYYKPALSSALRLKKSAEQLITGTADSFASENGIQILTDCVVSHIDVLGRLLQTSKGTFEFDSLVLALGASPFVLPIQGSGATSVLQVNQAADYRLFRERIRNAKHVTVIGPGLIGSEFASDLTAQDICVAVVGPDAWPVSALLPEVIGQGIQKALEQDGVEWFLERTTASIAASESGFQVTLSDGTVFETDVVLSAVGLKPNTNLAQQAGLSVGRGIIVNSFLETSVSGIYALGDCVEMAGQILPYVHPLTWGARALAKTLTGTTTEVLYPIMPVVIKTHQYPTVVVPAPKGALGAWVTSESDDNGAAARFESPDNTLLGFALGGDRVSMRGALVKELAPR